MKAHLAAASVPRHAGAGRHPRLAFAAEAKSCMPTPRALDPGGGMTVVAASSISPALSAGEVK
jgi:hypothetical protein